MLAPKYDASRVSVLAVDAHVHLHEVTPATLARAALNLSVQCPDAAAGVLLLAEMRGSAQYEAVRRICLQSVRTGTHEEEMSCWYRAGPIPLLIVAGRQILTAERIEILALGTTGTLPDGLPHMDVLAWIDEQGALPVLPWGVGKWIGARGAIVDRLIATVEPRSIFLGDNGGRPAFWTVRAFDMARDRGISILAGSDPLPLRGRSNLAGSSGFRLHAMLDPRTPGASLLLQLRAPGVAIEDFGQRRGLGAFFYDQSLLRLARRPSA